MSWIEEKAKSELERIREAQQKQVYPYFRPFESGGLHTSIDGKPLVNFSSNDYLGLTTHPKVIEAAHKALDRFACGLSSSRVQATTTAHVELEQRLAELVAGSLGAGDARAAGLGAGDCLIAVAASGRTPYALGAAEAAGAAGAAVIAVANNAGAPLLALADIPILLETPPEPLAGSTRLGAGTAQKIALNAISTMAGVLLGHVHDGMMVNLRADNAKLRDRAARIVGSIANVGEAQASAALEACGGLVKPAVLVASGAAGRDDAERRLGLAGQNLRAALGTLIAEMN